MNNTISSHLNLQSNFPKPDLSQINSQKTPLPTIIASENGDGVKVSISQEGLDQYKSSVSWAIPPGTPYITETPEI
ncbi:MAG: hypothetical protein GY860_14265, partial [Desulfobacteraceae bacterium]|nr:hypothetical protein [Desulfobacteraceae bacterium]